MPHSYDYISLFVSLIHIPVRFDNLLQRVDSVNDRFQLARFDELFERQQVFELVAAI